MTTLTGDTAEGIPLAFCWSRMGVNSGEELSSILRRKSHELSCGGLFVWGIGNNVVAAVRKLAQCEENPWVLFSPMYARAAKIDRLPESVIAWLDYIGETGTLTPLPDEVLVTSRGHTPRSAKRQYFALFCTAEEPVALGNFGDIDKGHLRNLDSGKPVGDSQVTAVVARREGSPTRRYSIAVRAKLVAPYCAPLATPVPLDEGDLYLLRNVRSAVDWSEMVQNLKRKLRGRAEV